MLTFLLMVGCASIVGSALRVDRSWLAVSILMKKNPVFASFLNFMLIGLRVFLRARVA